MEQRQILVTGGSGFIGRHLCRSLVKGEYSVHVLTRDRAGAAARLPEAVQLYQNLADIAPEQVFDGVINLAGEPLAGRWNTRLKQRFNASRIGTTDALYNYFVHAPQPPKVLISGSAIGYYGPHGNEPLDEDGGVNNCFSHQLCDSWETSARRFVNMGCRVCCIRTGVVLGADGGALGRMLPPFKMGLGGRLGNGRQYFSWIHMEDMVGILEHCLEHCDLRGPVNATSPGVVTNSEFTRQLANALRRPALLPMPAFLARLLFGEMAEELLLTGQRVIPAKIQKMGYQFRFPELPQALENILRGS